MRALLDVNVLIALLDGQHLHHDLAWNWLRDNIHHGWATCSATRNGCVRVMSQPKYPSSLPPRVVAGRLRDATRTEHHRCWADDVNLLDPGTAEWRHIVGPGQIADVHLLALAVAHEGRFVTFDARISPQAVVGAEGRHFCVI
ncbi:MAG: PIN domain-containing protein [Alphaproteobacteria bacterium]|nr:PIN domain-containing protein [Alphaproteobacteria bacterium]